MSTILVEQKGSIRLIKEVDDAYNLSDLKGDTYVVKFHPEISPEKIRKEELEFEQRVETEGVWFYSLESWDSAIDGGWIHIDSIGGFVGDDFTGSGYDTEMLDRLKA